MTSEFIFIYGVGTLATILAGLSGILFSIRKRVRLSKALPYMVLALASYFLVFQLLKLYANKNYVDFAAWNEITYNITQGQGPWSSIQDGFVPGAGYWFSAHFTPLIYLFALPFAIFQTPEVLIVSQFALLLVAVLGVYLYAKRWLGSREHALVIAAVLVLYPTYQYIHLYEFEMLRFSIPLLLFAFYALEEGSLKVYWLFLVLTLLVREEVAITTCLLGLYSAIFMRDRRWVGSVTAAISIVYFLVIMQMVMPFFRTDGSTAHIAASFFAPLGKTLPEVAIGIITKPDVVLGLIIDPVKLANLFIYGVPLLFIPLLAWPVLLIGSGNVGLNMLSGSIIHTTYFLYYLAPAIPFVFIGLVKGVAILGSRLDRLLIVDKGTGNGVAAVLFGLFSAAVVANLFFGPSPISLQFWFKDYRLAPVRTQKFHYTQYLVNEHDRMLKDVVVVVPKDAIVSAEQHILPSLYDRMGLKVFPDISGANFVVMDKRRKEKTGVGTVPGSWDGLRQNPQYYYDWVERDPTQWALVTSRDGYFVYKRVGPSQ